MIDLSATPFFLRGSGYAEGTLFPWTMSDFSLMDAIECGIVKLPRVPVADNIPGGEMPKFRNLWEHIRKRDAEEGPRQGRDARSAQPARRAADRARSALRALREDLRALGAKPASACRPASSSSATTLPPRSWSTTTSPASTARTRTARPRWRTAALRCSATSTSTATRSPGPNTLLIDSEQLESGEALDDNFRDMAADEIDRFRREIVERTGDRQQAENLTDQDLLREVMNTVGKHGRLGESIRCVVSVSMLTEGWDANTVTHVLGVRAFGTQLLCEQVIGRALRRQSYDLNEEDLFNVEYADVLGIPFDFTAKPVVAPPQPPRETIQVKAVRPERDALEIRFPRVAGYRVELPEERLTAEFNDDSVLELTPDLVGPSDHARTQASSAKASNSTWNTWTTCGPRRCSSTSPSACSTPSGATRAKSPSCTSSASSSASPSSGSTPAWSARAAPIRRSSCTRNWPTWPASGSPPPSPASMVGQRPIKAVLDPYNPTGSTMHVKFNTSKTDRWQTDARRCHINWVILDSDWEAEFCRVAESHPRVKAYVKNHNLGLEVPYRYGSETRKYLPDFIVLVDDGHGDDDLLHLIVEIKGYRREDAKEKKSTMETYWVPGVNNLGSYGRWAFAEFTDVYQIEADFEAKVEAEFNKMIESVAAQARRRKDPHGDKTPKPEKKKTVETLTHEEASRKNIPTAEFQSVMRKEEQSPDPRGVRAPQPRPRPATGLARQGRAGLVRPGDARAAALHPGEGASQGSDRRPAAPQQGRSEGRRRPDRSLRRLQRPARARTPRPSSTSTTPTGPTA